MNDVSTIAASLTDIGERFVARHRRVNAFPLPGVRSQGRAVARALEDLGLLRWASGGWMVWTPLGKAVCTHLTKSRRTR